MNIKSRCSLPTDLRLAETMIKMIIHIMHEYNAEEQSHI